MYPTRMLCGNFCSFYFPGGTNPGPDNSPGCLLRLRIPMAMLLNNLTP